MPTLFTVTDDNHAGKISSVWTHWAGEESLTFISAEKEEIKAGKIALSLLSPLLRDVIQDVGASQAFITVPTSSSVVKAALAVLCFDDSNTLFGAEIYEFYSNLGMEIVGEHIENIKEEKSLDEDDNKFVGTEIDEHSSDSGIKAKEGQEECIEESNANVENENHINEGSQEHVCTTCESVFSSRNMLRKHIATIHENKIHFCESCEYSNWDYQKLKLHIAVKHEGLRYACELCDFSSATKNYLKVHKENKHEGVKYQCNFCYISRNNLIRNRLGGVGGQNWARQNQKF